MKTKTTQLCIFVTVLALLAIGIYIYSTHYIAGLTKKTAELKQDINNEQVTFKHAESLRTALSSAAEQKDKITSYFIPPNGAVDFISHIEDTAKGFGLDYTTQDIVQKNNDDLSNQNKELLQVSFSAMGSWSNIMRLLKTVETLPYGVKIEKINLTGSTASSTKRWSAGVSFSVVKIKDK